MSLPLCSFGHGAHTTKRKLNLALGRTRANCFCFWGQDVGNCVAFLFACDGQCQAPLAAAIWQVWLELCLYCCPFDSCAMEIAGLFEKYAKASLNIAGSNSHVVFKLCEVAKDYLGST